MSGRRRTRTDGTVTGSSSGNVSVWRSKSGGDHSAGALPTSTDNACRATLSCCRSGGRNVRSPASWLSALRTSVRATLPAVKAMRTSSRLCSSAAMISFTALICANVEAIVTACVTVSAVRVKYAAASWRAWFSACALCCSTSRRVCPNRSGV